MTELDSNEREDRINEALAEFLQAADEGRPPDLPAFLARHADIADELSEFLQDRAVFQHRARPLRLPPVHPDVAPEPFRRKLGDFEIVREIGRGGMSVVYEARQLSLDRRVALKVLHAGLGFDASAVIRFRREAEAAAKLRHPHIVPVWFTGEEAGVYFHAMEFCDGPSLDRVLAERREVPFRRVAEWLADIADALHFAHEHGVIHRDVKPSNLLLAADGSLKINDFGLARLAEHAGVTVTGECVGSPAYMSPEQIATGRGPLDRRTDIYSLGATLYELLTRTPPFTGGREQVLTAILTDDPPPPHRLVPAVPRDLESICLKAMEKEPHERYATAAEMAADLRAFAGRNAISVRRLVRWRRLVKWARRRWTIVIVVLSVLLAGGVGSHAVWQSRSHRAERLQVAIDDALVAVMSGELESADAAISRAEQLGASAAWTAMLRGRLAYHRGEYDEAIRHLQQAVAENPQSVAARAMLASAYVAAGSWEPYEQSLDEIERLTPVTPEDHLFRGLAESYLDPRIGLRSVHEAVRLRNSPVARLVRADVERSLAKDTGNPADAEQAVNDAHVAREFLPDNSTAIETCLDVQLVAADIYGQYDEPEKREAALEDAARDEQALAQFPQTTSIVLTRADYFHAVGRGHESLQLLRDAWERDHHPSIGYRLALHLFDGGQTRESLAVLDPSPHSTNNADSLRVVLLLELGRRADAEAAYQQIAARDTTGIAAIFRPGLRRLFGDATAAQAEARRIRESPLIVPKLRRKFYAALLDFHCGDVSGEQLLAVADPSMWDRCEASYFLGLQRLCEGDREGAREHFARAIATPCRGFMTWDWSHAFLSRMQADAAWPSFVRAK